MGAQCSRWKDIWSVFSDVGSQERGILMRVKQVINPCYVCCNVGIETGDHLFSTYPYRSTRD